MSSYLVSPDGLTFWKTQLKGKSSIVTMGPRGYVPNHAALPRIRR